MKGKSILIGLIFFIILFSGCVQLQKSSKNDEIQALKEFPLPGGWVMKDLPSDYILPSSWKVKTLGAIDSFEFRNDKMLCTKAVMAIMDKVNPSFYVTFVKKWTERDYKKSTEAWDIFNECRDLQCMERSGYRLEPDFSTKNYSVYIDNEVYIDCEIDFLIGEIVDMLKDFE